MGTTILMVEQNARRALGISHHAFVLELGKIRFDGTGDEILNNAELRKVYLGG
jgi:ABC-type branched-subunit amino acid transport system ATPase component